MGVGYIYTRSRRRAQILRITLIYRSIYRLASFVLSPHIHINKREIVMPTLRSFLLSVASVFLTLFAGTAQSIHLYTFTFDEVVFNNQTYAQEVLVFESPKLLALGEKASRSSGALNGYAPSEMSYCATGTSQFNFCGSVDFTKPEGAVAGFEFIVELPPSSYGVGDFVTNLAGRMIISAGGASADGVYGTGRLNIVDTSPIPEPSSLALLGLGFVALSFGRRRRVSAA